MNALHHEWQTKAGSPAAEPGTGETSALARIRVEDAFYELVREIRKEIRNQGGTTGGKKRMGRKQCEVL